ncbi:hypothetical protein HMPREF0663_12199 [Hoylesella oralis ATCC 33269]|uniref:Uncharacterized protein n=1 Tax=Hoylesella oralis ATCC 33269 TaxID=873533 RepID=E7RSD1_9BACT|nr:hypothetical protein HMPREF0663_12199 [Hoylesella oralis ATCC 33269]
MGADFYLLSRLLTQKRHKDIPIKSFLHGKFIKSVMPRERFVKKTFKIITFYEAEKVLAHSYLRHKCKF